MMLRVLFPASILWILGVFGCPTNFNESEAANPAVAEEISPDSLTALGTQLAFEAYYDSAAVAFAQAADEYAYRGDWAKHVDALLNQGVNERDGGRYELGLRTISRADSIAERRVGFGQATDSLVWAIKREHGVAQIRRSNLTGAVATLVGVASSADGTELAASLQALGWAYQEGNFENEAFLSFREALATVNRSGIDSPALTSRIYNSIGIHYYQRQDADSSIVYHVQAAELRRDYYGTSHPLFAASIANLALAVHLRGDRALATELYADATSIYVARLGANHPEVARCLTNLGLLYKDDGRLDLAELALTKSAEMRLTALGPEHTSLRYTYGVLADVAFEKGEYRDALRLAEHTVTLAAIQSSQSFGTTAEALLIMGKSLEALGQHARADSTYDASRRQVALEPSGQRRAVAALDYLRARNLYGWGKFVKASSVLDGQCEKLNERRSFYDVNRHDCQILRARIDAARGLWESAQYGLDSVTQDLSRPGLLDRVDFLRSTIDATMAHADLNRRRYQESNNERYLHLALQWLERSRDAASALRERYIDDGSKRAVARASAAAIDSLISTSLILFTYSGREEYITKAFAAAEDRLGAVVTDAVRHARIRKAPQIPGRLMRREAELRDAVQRAIRLANADSDSSRLDLVNVSNQYDSLLRGLEHSFPQGFDLARLDPPRKVADIVSAVADDETMVVFVFNGDRVWSFVVASQNVRIGTFANAELIKAHTSILRTAISAHDYDDFVLSSRALYKLLIEPIEHHIEGKNLIVIPDGVLHFVPFEVLLTEDVEPSTIVKSHRLLPYLIRKNPVTYSYSATLLYQLRTQTRTPPTLSFFGIAPVFSRPLSTDSHGSVLMRQNVDSTVVKLRGMHLPASLDEVALIRRKFRKTQPLWKRYFSDRATVLIHSRATESAFKSANLEDYQYVHVASHAFANEANPDLSGIIFSQEPDGSEDGVLHLKEVYNLKINADIVVLSACETGVGKLATGEGIIGLTRGFLYSGAKNVMVSLWKADDAMTRDLMVTFYGELLRGASKAKALQAAKLSVIKKDPVHARPFFWAQFVLVGA